MRHWQLTALTVIVALLAGARISAQGPQRGSAQPCRSYEVTGKVKEIEKAEGRRMKFGTSESEVFAYYRLKLEIVSCVEADKDGAANPPQGELVVACETFDKNPISKGQYLKGLVRYGGDESFHGHFLRSWQTVPEPECAPPGGSGDATAALTKGNNAFALDLYSQLRTEQGNLFFSPISISAALAMTFAGARGDTETQMAKTLHFELDQARLHAAFKGLIDQLNAPGKDRGYKLSTANALWGQKGYGFLGVFVGLVGQNYGAGFKEVDFTSDRSREETRQIINKWVEKETHDKIKNIIGEGVLTNLTRLVLANAIYFKGDWVAKFKEECTKKAPFMLGDNTKVDVPLMNQTAEFKYTENDLLQVLELPYVGEELAMDILLPRSPDGLGQLEEKLTVDALAGWLSQLNKSEVVVAIPKFKTTKDFSLNGVLGKMGMPAAFCGDADFSGMNGKKNDLFMSAVLHKAFVEVNEEGTEAAAATVGVLGATSVRERLTFRADHPFVFLIRDLRSGSILFMGRIADPR